MNRLALTCAAAAATFLSAGASAAPLNQYMGRWQGVTPSDLPVIEISRVGGDVVVRAEGNCAPTNCDWGRTTAEAYSSSAGVAPEADAQLLVARYSQSPGRATLLIRLESGQLSVDFLRDFSPGDSRNDYLSHSTLRRQRVVPPRPLPPTPLPPSPTPPSSQDCIGFNITSLSVERRGARWFLMEGSHSMLSAPNQAEMERARRIIRNYRLTRHCFVGRPDPSLNYWLDASGQIPSGAMAGEDCIGMDPNQLTIRRNASGSFSIVDRGSHFVFSAPTRSEARDVRAVIQRYQATNACYVGRPDASMIYLRR